MLRVIIALAALLAPLSLVAQAQTGPNAQAASAMAGRVQLIEGDVRFFDPKNAMRRPAVGDPIFEGEAIATGSDGEVHLAMEDGGHIGVRPATKMRIVNFKAEGGADDHSVIGLLEGGFRSVTGWIAKTEGRSYTIRTPTATIGVRGTDHEPRVIPEGSTEGEPGSYDRVYAGETVIQTSSSSISVRPNQAGFVPRRGAARPRLLDRVPAFYRPTRNEKVFEGLHERIQRGLDRRREDRRKLVEGRRAQVQQKIEARKAVIEKRREDLRSKGKGEHGEAAAGAAERPAVLERRRQIEARQQARQQLREERESARKGEQEKKKRAGKGPQHPEPAKRD